MSENSFNKIQLAALVLTCLEDQADDWHWEQLDRILRDSPEAVAYYGVIVTIYGGIHQPCPALPEMVRKSGYAGLLESNLFREIVEKDLLEYENRLSGDEHGESAESTGLSRTSRRVSTSRPGRKDILRYAAKIAAIFIFSAALILVDRTLMRSTKVEPYVGSIVESFGAQWDDRGISPTNKTPLKQNQSLRLLSGYARIACDGGADVILQGPAEFTLESSDQLYLRSGVITANVPKRAIGFLVRTPGATIIDYGTTFGVTAHENGLTETHVFRGKVELRSGSDALVYDHALRLSAGQAGQVNRQGRVERCSSRFSSSRYIQALPESMISHLTTVRLNLADMVGGGTGYNTGKVDFCIDPQTGALSPKEVSININKGFREHEGTYTPVEWTPYIDGVFVPDGGSGEVVISSAGHGFPQCPDTCGSYLIGAINGANITPRENAPTQQVRLMGLTCGTPETPAIFMHANLGITFDLDQIRRDHPGRDITSFQALGGVGDTVHDTPSSADIWVLVDGEVRYARHSLQRNQGEEITVALSVADRFLTLVTTDDREHSHLALPNDCDWCLFARPEVTLELKDQFRSGE